VLGVLNCGRDFGTIMRCSLPNIIRLGLRVRDRFRDRFASHLVVMLSIVALFSEAAS
jgi:hypothetical protein